MTIFQVRGLHCPACELLVADELSTDPEVSSVRVDRSANLLCVDLAAGSDPTVLKTRWNGRLDPLGYRVYLETEDPRREARRETLVGLGFGAAFLGLFALLQISGVVNLLTPDNLGMSGAFVLGLLASVSSCFALVGGLLVSYTTALGRRNPRLVGPGLGAFHTARLGIFAVGGGLLGLVGEALGSVPDLSRVLLTVASVIMAGLGLNLLGVSLPGGRKGKTVVGKARGLAAWGSVGGGAALGASTFFLPCGFTQSVQFQALAAGGFLPGASLTLAFALGTLPVLGSLGWLLGKGLAGSRRAVLLKAGGTVVLGLGLFQLWGALHLWGVRFPSF
ncbi:MAG TPA: sulfite exporter TauE/SafE family protein [Spirochaetia bacterium]|nr:sulfite exporter TauE/SafE family protein [Spirochaetia bacterium]